MTTDGAREHAALAFVCAMPMELRPLARRLSLREEQRDGLRLATGRTGTRPVVAVVTGMGPARASAGCERLLAAMDVDRVVVVGIAGALDDSTPIGTLVVPEGVVDAATGREHRPEALGPVPACGRMWTSEALTTDPELLARLRASGVVALDMETAAIGQVCEAHGTAWTVFRAISDRAGDGSVDEEVFHLSTPEGTPDAIAVLRYLLRHPGRIAVLARLARGSGLAARVAAEAALRACGVE
jgi:adenosylhomocysteine nucleosidase